jgi:hypothetical protein
VELAALVCVDLRGQRLVCCGSVGQEVDQQLMDRPESRRWFGGEEALAHDPQGFASGPRQVRLNRLPGISLRTLIKFPGATPVEGGVRISENVAVS